MKKILVISTTQRKNGNSAVLARAFARGAGDAGHDVEYLSLADKSIHFCIGCFACTKTEKCFMNDDASAIVEKMRYADVLVFATPIYSNQMCGSMKTLLDRTNPIFLVDYCFREIYLLTTAAMNDEKVADGAVAGIQGWIDCFHKAQLKGVVRGVGIGDIGEAKKNTKVLAMTYEMGKGV